MTTFELFRDAWSWEPSVVGGCMGLLVAYFALLRSRLGVRSLYYVAGVVVLLLSLVSPIDRLGEQYLFSVHMLQHMLLVLVVPPLLLLGIPAWTARDLLSVGWVGKAERFLRRPFIAWAAGMTTLWLWHAPVLYNAALARQGIHILEHESFLVTATIFWWPVVAPVEEARIPPLSAIFYLAAAVASQSILGIILTFAPVGLYPAYLHPFDSLGALSLIRSDWGISVEIDQQLGGLLMWIGGGAILLIGILGALNRWYAMGEEDEVTPIQALAQPETSGRRPVGSRHARVGPVEAGTRLQEAGK